MTKLGVTPFVFGSYTKFIPYYLYSIFKSYPNYRIKVFVEHELSPNEKMAIKLIKNRLSGNFEIVENFMGKLQLPMSKEKDLSQLKKSLRWLIPYEQVKDFDYIYIGDVDFLILKEQPSLLEAHLNHCKITGLPYSNAVRPGTRRLTGLHFVNVKRYYGKLKPHMEHYLNNLDEVLSIVRSGQGNEEFLYHLIEKEIGFTGLNRLRYRKHHGFHLGCVREGKIKQGYLGYYDPPRPDRSKSEFERIKGQLLQYFNDPLFLEIVKLVPEQSVINLMSKVKSSH